MRTETRTVYGHHSMTRPPDYEEGCFPEPGDWFVCDASRDGETVWMKVVGEGEPESAIMVVSELLRLLPHARKNNDHIELMARAIGAFANEINCYIPGIGNDWAERVNRLVLEILPAKSEKAGGAEVFHTGAAL